MNICKICGKEIPPSYAYSFKDKTLDCYHKECRIMNCFDDKPWTYFSLMKEFDIPYIEEIWFQQMIREFKTAIRTHSYRNVFGKYLSTMKLLSWKPFGFKDSQELNYYYSSVENNLLRNILLDREIPQEYFDVIKTNIK